MQPQKTYKEWSWGSKAAIIATLGTFIATAFIAWAYFSQIKIMKGTLELMKESQQITSKPLLRISLHPDPSRIATSGYEKTEEGGERWLLYYYIYNFGDNPAYELKYFHWVDNDSTFKPVDDSLIQRRWEDDLIFPYEVIECGYDPFLRQAYYDAIKEGKTCYRHFVEWHKDDLGNQYGYHAVWRIVYEKEGLPLKYPAVSYHPISK